MNPVEQLLVGDPQSATTGETVRTALTVEETVVLDLLRSRQSEITAWVGYILQSAAMFSILNVALYKFALDANSTPPLRIALSDIGLAGSLLGYVAVWMAESLRRRNRAEQQTLLTHLRMPYEPTRADIIKYCEISAALAVTLNALAWLFILVTT